MKQITTLAIYEAPRLANGGCNVTYWTDRHVRQHSLLVTSAEMDNTGIKLFVGRRKKFKMEELKFEAMVALWIAAATYDKCSDANRNS